MKNSLQRLSHRGYTLIEVLAAAAVVSVGMAAAVSLTSSLMLQEELAWRTAITRNYQENMMRLWQLGLGASYSKEVTNITAVLPRQNFSPRLNEAIYGEPELEETGSSRIEGLGKLEAARVTAVTNVAKDPPAEVNGNSFELNGHRPALPRELRTNVTDPLSP